MNKNVSFEYRADIRNYGVIVNGITAEEEAILKYAFGEKELRNGGMGLDYRANEFLKNVGVKYEVNKVGNFERNREITVYGDIMPYSIILKEIGDERAEREARTGGGNDN